MGILEQFNTITDNINQALDDILNKVNLGTQNNGELNTWNTQNYGIIGLGEINTKRNQTIETKPIGKTYIEEESSSNKADRTNRVQLHKDE